MIQLINGKLRAPANLTLNGFTLRRVIGGEVHETYNKLAVPQPDNRILDSLVFNGVNCVMIVSVDVGPHGPLLHASISHSDHDPSWETIKALKQAVFGDIDVMMVLPRQADWVNVHEHAFHLWQIPEKWGIA